MNDRLEFALTMIKRDYNANYRLKLIFLTLNKKIYVVRFRGEYNPDHPTNSARFKVDFGM